MNQSNNVAEKCRCVVCWISVFYIPLSDESSPRRGPYHSESDNRKIVKLFRLAIALAYASAGRYSFNRLAAFRL